MRIISGEYKGRRIAPPKKLPVRPTTDMAKEALFNILNNLYYFDELKVLDLFAGTGSISYEFASRGSEQIVAIDQDHLCTRFISQTNEEFSMPIEVVTSDVYKFLDSCGEQFDVIFADPPYASSQDEFESIWRTVFERDLLSSSGTLIIEHSKKTDLSHLNHFKRSSNYGGSVFSFFEAVGDEEE